VRVLRKKTVVLGNLFSWGYRGTDSGGVTGEFGVVFVKSPSCK